MTTLTEQLQANVRAITETKETFEGDLHALMDLYQVEEAAFSGRLISLVELLTSTRMTSAGALNYLLYNPELVPAALFVNGEQGVWYDPSDLSTLWADTAGTIPATINGAVARMDDKSGNGHHLIQATLGLRPILRADGALRYLEFDGSTSSRRLAVAGVNLSGSDKLTLWAGVRKIGTAGTGGVIESGVSAGVGIENGSFLLCAPDTGVTDNYAVYIRGTETTGFAITSFVAPITNVISAYMDIAGAARANEIFPRVNGAVPTLGGRGSANAGTGNFGNLPITVGARPSGGGAQFFNGRLYGLIIRGGASNSGTISLTERYIGSKTGITIS